MHFEWSEEQLALRREAGRFGREQLNDDLEERERSAAFSRKAFEKCAEFGILRLPLPPEYGGSDADPLTLAGALEGLGNGCRDGGLLFSLSAHLFSVVIPILKFGSEEQKRAYLPRLTSGEWIGAHAISEAQAGSDALALRTRAHRDGDSYLLRGSKTFVTNAPVADLLIVFASVAPERSSFGVSAFLVARDTPGLSVGPPFEKMGLRTSPLAEVVLDGCRVPAADRLGPEGAGMAIFNVAMSWERTFIPACALGAMERQLETSLAYARDRVQFGQPIGRFQSVANKLVDMKLRLEAGRLLLYRAAWLLGRGRRAELEAALAKLFVSEAAVQTHLDAVQLHGGSGYMTATGVERHLRDSIAGTIYSGTSEMQRVLIGNLLGL